MPGALVETLTWFFKHATHDQSTHGNRGGSAPREWDGLLDRMFPEGALTTHRLPWPRMPQRLKGGAKTYDLDTVIDGLTNTVEDIDPTDLHANQGAVTRAGVSHYLNPTTRDTIYGQDNRINRLPTIYRRADGRNLILSGHHRAAAAWLRGVPLKARVIHERAFVGAGSVAKHGTKGTPNYPHPIGGAAGWAPKMSRIEAEDWARNSAYKGLATFVGRRGSLDKILATGFHDPLDENRKHSAGSVWGRGIYLGIADVEAEEDQYDEDYEAAYDVWSAKWEQAIRTADMVQMGQEEGLDKQYNADEITARDYSAGLKEVREKRDTTISAWREANPEPEAPITLSDPSVNLYGPMKLDYSNGSEGVAGAVNVKVNITNPARMNVSPSAHRTLDDYSALDPRFEEAYLDKYPLRNQEYIRENRGVDTEHAAEILRQLGYDALVITQYQPPTRRTKHGFTVPDPDGEPTIGQGFSSDVGGPQIIIWDPAKATVVTDTPVRYAPRDYDIIAKHGTKGTPNYPHADNANFRISVYDAEDSVWQANDTDREVGQAEAEAFIADLFPGDNITIEPMGEGEAYNDGVVDIGAAAGWEEGYGFLFFTPPLTMKVLLHEAAHLKAERDGSDQGHGPVWADTYRDLIAERQDPTIAAWWEQDYAAITKHGQKGTPGYALLHPDNPDAPIAEMSPVRRWHEKTVLRMETMFGEAINANRAARLSADAFASLPIGEDDDTILRAVQRRVIADYTDEHSRIHKPNHESRQKNKKLTTLQAISTTVPKFVNREWHKTVERRFADAIAQGEIERDRLAEWNVEAQSVADDYQIYSRVSPRVLANILTDGQFRSQHETGTSNGMYSPRARAIAEHLLHGIDVEDGSTPGTIFGFASNDGNGHIGTGLEDDYGDDDPVHQYGSIAVELNDDVRARTTITIGDSLDQSGVFHIGKDMAQTYGAYEDFSTYTTAVIDYEEQVNFAPVPIDAVTYHAWSPELISGSGYSTGDPSMWEEGADPYVEAQFHGGIAVSDIKRVIMRADEVDGELLDDLQRAGIPVQILAFDYDDGVHEVTSQYMDPNTRPEPIADRIHRIKMWANMQGYAGKTLPIPNSPYEFKVIEMDFDAYAGAKPKMGKGMSEVFGGVYELQIEAVHPDDGSQMLTTVATIDSAGTRPEFSSTQYHSGDYDPMDALREYLEEVMREPVRTASTAGDVADADGQQLLFKHATHDQRSHGRRGSASALARRGKQGGFTFNLTTAHYPSTGFAVAVPGHSEIFAFDAFTDEALVDFIDTNQARFADNPALHIGGWYDRANDEMVLDIVEVFDNKSLAIQAGQLRNEQAIFDLENLEEINTGGSGGREDITIVGKEFGKPRRRWSAFGLGDDDAGAEVGVGQGSSWEDDPHASARREVLKHGTKGTPGYRLLHPGTGYTQGGSSADLDVRIGTGEKANDGRKGKESDPARGSARATTMGELSPANQDKIAAQVAANWPHPDDTLVNADNVLDLMVSNLSVLLERATPAERTFMGRWYERAHERAQLLADRHGRATREVVGVMAALSPQHEWGNNLAAAEFVVEQIAADAEFDITPKMAHDIRAASVGGSGKRAPINIPSGTYRLSQLDDRTAAWVIKELSKTASDGEKLTSINSLTMKKQIVSWSCGVDSAVLKAVRIMRGSAPQDILGGHKVRSFHNNIARPRDDFDVTMDTHAVSAATMTRMGAQSESLGKVFGSGSNAADNTKGTYALFADAYRIVAANHGMKAHEAQAAIWLIWQHISDAERLPIAKAE